MGFSATTDAGRVRVALACDAPGCGVVIGDAHGASVVVAPGGQPAPVRVGCSEPCARALMTPGAAALDLASWWDAMGATLGLDDGDDDDGAVDPDDFLQALAELEALVQRSGIPTGLTVSEAVGLGYVGRQHVAAVLSGQM